MKLDYKTIYFALVSLVSILVVAFSLASLAYSFLIILFPGLAAHDLETAARIYSGPEGIPDYVSARVTPLWTEMLNEVLRVIVFGGLLAWHLPRLLRRKDS